MQIPASALPAETLTALLEDFVSREGTDYGAVELAMSEKLRRLRLQLERQEIVIVFDEQSETCNIIPREQLLPRRGR